MKLTVQQVMDATITLSQIIRDRRPMPQKGKYRLARLHSKLLPEFNAANAQRDDLIKAYDYHAMVPVNHPPGSVIRAEDLGELQASPEWSVPPDKIPEFATAWKQIADEEIDVDVEPIPLSQLDLGDAVNGSIEANEIIALGDLVKPE